MPLPRAVRSFRVAGRDPDGHGVLFHVDGRRVMVVEGSPEQMGRAHARLLTRECHYLVERVLYGVGAFDSVAEGKWFFDTMDEIRRRTLPFIPARFLEEIDAMADELNIPHRDARLANLFPERFHCSGVAVRGKATADGRVIHARVLDYMRDIGLQNASVVTVFRPDGYHTWMSVGYAGFVGTVTAMNEKGLAVGEMGGRGEGLWDGTPMSLLLRDVMERAENVDQAVDILRRAKRTCEYYYVLSDRTGAMVGIRATPDEFLVLHPGEQHPLLPRVPDDCILISADRRAEVLSERLHARYGRITVGDMIEIIKRPVAMESNLHDAIMLPESLDLYAAEAGRFTPACDEPYLHVNLKEVLRWYETARRSRTD
ncbi:hypothetical protein JCM19992_33430 [Thermostilla marina]